MNELRVYGASDDLVEFRGAFVEEFNVYKPATFEIIIDTLSDRAWFRLETSFTDGWELKLTTQSARSNQAIDVRFDQTDSYEMDPMIVFDIPDHSRVEVYRDE